MTYILILVTLSLFINNGESHPCLSPCCYSEGARGDVPSPSVNARTGTRPGLLQQREIADKRVYARVTMERDAAVAQGVQVVVDDTRADHYQKILIPD